MATDGRRPSLHAVRAFTRFHFAGVGRRRFSRDQSRDRRRSSPWGWHQNVVGVGVSWKRVERKRIDGEYCVTFFVLRKEPLRRLLKKERIPRQVEFDSIDATVITDVIEVPGRCVAHAPMVRPVQPGAEVGHVRGGRGTLGLIVRKAGSPTPLALSCAHVLARSGALADFGRDVEQPTGDLGEVIGNLTDDVTTIRSGTLVTADVALARLSVGASPGVLGFDVVPTGVSDKTAEQFSVGTKTTLFGATTPQAMGQVVAFASTFDIAEMPFVNGHVEFSGLVAYETRSAKGDSGGPVMSRQPGEEGVVLGLHTAGRSDGKLGLFQPIGPIMKRFNLVLA